MLIDLSALDHNLATIRGMLSPGVQLGAVVKADAYGLGAARIARRMAAHVDMLVVFGLDEAEVVHAAAPATPVLALMPCHHVDAGGPMHGMLLRGLLHLTAHDAGQVARLERVAEALGVRIPLHVEVDTGLGRGGCLPAEASALVTHIRSSERLRLAGAFTHYASAGGSESATDAQRERFEAWAAHAPIPDGCLLHSASTFAAIRDCRFHHGMVRVGLAWTGLAFEGTRDGRSMGQAHTLRPMFSWRSHVMQVRTLPAGAAVGYGSRWVARVPSVVGLVPVGYADGYPLLPMDSRTLRPSQPERRVVRVQYGPRGCGRMGRGAGDRRGEHGPDRRGPDRGGGGAGGRRPRRDRGGGVGRSLGAEPRRARGQPDRAARLRAAVSGAGAGGTAVRGGRGARGPGSRRARPGARGHLSAGARGARFA